MASAGSTSTMNAAAVSPGVQRPNVISVKGFRIITQKLPILKAEPIEEMTKRLGIAPPEMIFNAFDALDRVDKTGTSMLRVAHSKEWQKSR